MAGVRFPKQKTADCGQSAVFEFFGQALFLVGRLDLVERVEGVLQGNQVFAGFERVEHFLLFLELIVAVAGGLDGQADAAFVAVNFNHAGADVLADLEHVLDLLHAFLADLRDVDEAVNFVLQTDKRAEAGELGDFALHEVADFVKRLDLFPRVNFELLHAERDALVGAVHFEHVGFHFVALFEHFGRMIDLARPRHVGDVNHAVNAFFEFHKRAVAGEVADLAFDLGADGVFAFGVVPRIAFQLADAEGNFLLVAVDAEDDGFDFLILFQNVAGLGHALGPGKFGDVDKTFHAGFELHKRAVGHEADDLALDLLAGGIFRFDVVPRIGHLLLEAEADAFLFLVHVQHNHVEFLADLEHFGWMVQPAPTHVGDVEQAVEAVQINKRAEIRDVLDRALADVAGHHFRKELGALVAALGLDEFAAGQDDVLALLIDLDDLEFVAVADERLEILRRDHVNLRRRQKRLDADVDDHPALDDGLDFAHDAAAFVANGKDALPVFLELCFFVREDNGAFLVFELLDEHVNFAADLDGVEVNKFIVGNDAFAFVADVHEDFLGTDFDDDAFDDLALSDEFAALFQGLFHGEHNFTELNCGRLFISALREI